MQSRNRAIAVASVEFLADAAPVYNLEIAGEHVYEITHLALLVHNANWDCGEFLELQTKVRAKKSALTAAEQTRYDELLDMVKNHFRKELGSAVDDLAEAAPADLLKSGAHLHHILAKLGREIHRDRIIAVQKRLFYDYQIDPFMSADIFIYAPSRGVHSNDAIGHVLGQLEDIFFEKDKAGNVISELKPDPDVVKKLLRRLGGWAQSGGLNQ